MYWVMRQIKFIGHIMKKYNVIEYKSPDDNLTIDDFYKTVGYACLYKGYGKYVDQIPVNELTISIFRERYPRKMFLTLKEYGHKIEEKYPGIYYVHDLPFPAQVVVIKQLNRIEHKSLRVLSVKANKEDVKAAKEIAMAEGRKAGMTLGRAEGRAEGEANLIRNMNKNGMLPEQISAATGKSLGDVKIILAGKKVELV